MLNSAFFSSTFGFTIPPILNRFYIEIAYNNPTPLRFRFPHVCHTLEIQHYLDMGDHKNYRPEKKLFSFALNTDGFELLADLNTDSLNILQDEFGDVDDLDLTIVDLLTATIQTKW